MLSELIGNLRWRWAKYRLANADVWSGGGMWSVPAADESTRKSRTLVVFSDGVEEHVRVPIDPPEVSAAADRAGLVLLEVFWSANRFRTFYLLRKPAR